MWWTWCEIQIGIAFILGGITYYFLLKLGIVSKGKWRKFFQERKFI